MKTSSVGDLVALESVLPLTTFVNTPATHRTARILFACLNLEELAAHLVLPIAHASGGRGIGVVLRALEIRNNVALCCL